MADTNTREHRLWSQLALWLVILAFALSRMGFVPTDLKRVQATLSFALSLYLLGSVCEGIYFMYFSVPSVEDERDRLIQLKGTDSARNLLACGIVAMLYVFVFKEGGLSTACLAGWLLYLLLVSLIVSRARQIRLYHFHEWWVPESWRRNRLRRALGKLERRRQERQNTGKPDV